MAGLRAVFFDAGGTLIAPHPSVGEVYAAEARGLGAATTAVEVQSSFGRIVPDDDRRIRSGEFPYPVSDADDRAMWRRRARAVHGEVASLRAVAFDAWFERVHGAFTDARNWRPYPETAAVLAACRGAGLRVGIVSNWSTHLHGICRDLRLAAGVDFILASCSEGVRKPQGEIFRRALARAGVSPDEAVHVGDSYEEDVHGARSAGVRAVWLDRSGGAARDGVPVVSTLAGLLPMLEGA